MSLVALLWVAGMALVGRANRGSAWHDSAGDAPDTQPAPKGHSRVEKEHAASAGRTGTRRTALVFLAAAVVTLVAGVVPYALGTAGLFAVAAG